jgi:hypothetical protein
VDAGSLAQLLHVLAAMRPYYTFSSFEHASAAAATEDIRGCDAKGMWQGSNALQDLGCAIAKHLITPQQQQQQQQQQEIDTASATQDQKQKKSASQQQQQWWNWWQQRQPDEQQQQRQQQQHAVPAVPLLQLQPFAVLDVLTDLAALSQGFDKQSKQGQAYAEIVMYLLETQVPVLSGTQQQQQQQQQEPLLYRWHLPELLALMDMLYAPGGPGLAPVGPAVNDKLAAAAAAAHQVHLLADWIASSSSSSSSEGAIGRRRKAKLNLSNLRASLTSRPTSDSQAGSSEVSYECSDSQARLNQLLAGSPDQLHVQLAAAADFIHVLTRHDQYQPGLLSAAGELLVAISSSRRQLLLPEQLSKLVSSLANFNYCSPPAAAAVQQLTAAALPSTRCSVVTTARLAWGLAVLDQREATLWRSIQLALQHSMDREWRAKQHKMAALRPHKAAEHRAAAEQQRKDIWLKVRCRDVDCH